MCSLKPSQFCTSDGKKIHTLQQHQKLEKNESNYLHIAAKQNRIDIVKWLIENGANPNTQDKNLHTALHFASTKTNPGRTSFLYSCVLS